MVEGTEKLDWLHALREGDASACEHLHSFVRDRVLPALPLPPGVNREDVLADTVSTVWLSIKSLREESKFFSFAATIARRIASRQRRECNRFAALPQEARLPIQEPVAPSSVERNEMLEILPAALQRSDQQLFKLLYIIGATSPEVQEALDISPEILRKRKHRLLLKLRHTVTQVERTPLESVAKQAQD